MNVNITHTTRTGFTLFLVGLAGVASLLMVDFPLTNMPKVVLQKFSPSELKLLILVNPTLLMTIGVIVGSLLHRRAGLFIVNFTDFNRKVLVANLLAKGLLPGLLAGLLIVGVMFAFQQLIPGELSKLGKEPATPALARFLYGGITEEIIVRFGVMTLFAWLLQLPFRSVNSVIYWIAIAGAALLFGAGHLPAMHLLVHHPSPLLTLYIVTGNALAGLVFGFVYWRYGLVFAMLAHIAAHLILIANELIIG